MGSGEGDRVKARSYGAIEADPLQVDYPSYDDERGASVAFGCALLAAVFLVGLFAGFLIWGL